MRHASTEEDVGTGTCALAMVAHTNEKERISAERITGTRFMGHLRRGYGIAAEATSGPRRLIGRITMVPRETSGRSEYFSGEAVKPGSRPSGDSAVENFYAAPARLVR